MSMKLKAKSS